MDTIRQPSGPYRGAGQADPGKPRADRESKLRSIARWKNGHEVLLALEADARGTEFGVEWRPFVRIGDLIEAILRHEYPGT